MRACSECGKIMSFSSLFILCISEIQMNHCISLLDRDMFLFWIHAICFDQMLEIALQMTYSELGFDDFRNVIVRCAIVKAWKALKA